MTRLADLIAPRTIEEFRDQDFGKRSFFVHHETNPVEGLVSLDEIEARLNDGCCGFGTVAMIGSDSRKMQPREIYAEPLGKTWSAAYLKKSRVKALLEAKHTFVMHNLSQMNPKVDALIASIEAEFPKFHADVHLYVSPGPGGTAYKIHRDDPQHKIYVQLIGTTHWTVYKGDDVNALDIDFQVVLQPGSMLYMPPRVFHKVANPDGPRVSLSIPFFLSPEQTAADRTFIPFRRIFEGR